MFKKLAWTTLAIVAGATGAIAVQPVIAEPQQQTLTLEQLREEIGRLESRVAKLEEQAKPQLWPLK